MTIPTTTPTTPPGPTTSPIEAPAPTRGAQTSAQVVAALRAATKRYGATVALDGVDLEIRSGEVVALLGPNGAGKTTAIGLLLGLRRATSGDAQLFGGDPRRAETRMRTGVMMQISGVPETLTVREHLTLQRSYYPAPRPAGELLVETGLEPIADRAYGRLSGGQKQRLHLALALCGDPELLFLDEPTTGLDVLSKRALWDLIRHRIGRGASVVLTTHDLDEADALAHRVVVLDHGRVIADAPPAQIKRLAADRRVRVATRLSDAELAGLPGATRVRRDGAVAEILTTEAEETVRRLLDLDGGASELTVVDAGLEEAFLALTNDPSEVAHA